MARFDVRANLNRASSAQVPFLLELQSDLLSGLATRVVAPLVPATAFGTPASRLNPVFRIGSRTYVMDTALVAGVPARVLGDKVAALPDRAAEVLGAVDFLVSGI
ncbi:MAG: CcdB family protein [Betaproteobacteria bacterium]